MERLALGIREHFSTRFPEWTLAAVMLVQGVQLLRSDVLNSTKAYVPLQQVGTNELFGWTSIAVAAVWLVALFLNGTFTWFRRISPWVRSLAAFGSGVYWSVWATGLQIGNPAGTAAINYAGLAALATVYAVMTAREVGYVDKEAKLCSHRSRQLSGGRLSVRHSA